MTDDEIIHQLISKFYKNKIIKGDNYYKIIFSQSFAQAFWGYSQVCPSCGAMWMHPTHCCEYQEIINVCSGETFLLPRIDAWRYHLLQMITHEEPLKYVGQFLDKQG
jgi:hypothetical protein